MTSIRVYATTLLLAAVATVGCSDSVTRLSPSGPTPVKMAAESGGDEINGAAGFVDRSGGAVLDAERVAEWAAASGWSAAAGGFAVEGTDSITAVSGVCPARTITVRGVPVLLNAATTYTAPATCASLAVGTTVTVTGLLEVTATGFTVTATNIAFPAAPGTEVVNGVVASFTGLCPALTVTLQGAGGVVVTSATTAFTPVGACATVAAGKTVKATGTRNATGQLVASQFEVVDTTAVPVNVSGTVASFLGTCPALTITLQGTAGVVVTSATTVFEPATLCASIAAGSMIKATGTRNATGQLVATKVQLDSEGTGGGGGGAGRKVSGDVTIGDVRGTCPALTLLIQGARVLTTATTVYVDGSCASLREGTKIKIDAVTQADGSYVAERIVVEKVPGRPASGDGKVDAVSGVCPNLNISVRGVNVTTNAATVFTGGTCQTLARGAHIDVTALVDDTTGSIVATSVAIRSNGNGGGNGGGGNGNGNGGGKK